MNTIPMNNGLEMIVDQGGDPENPVQSFVGIDPEGYHLRFVKEIGF